MYGERRLIAGCHAGLCNRLRVMLSGRELAKESGRRFLVFWPVTDSCGCPFNRLFDEQITPASSELVRKLQPKYMCRYWYGPGSPKMGQPIDLMSEPDQDILAFSYSWLLYPGRYPLHDLLQDRVHRALDRLQPADSIHAKIEAFKSRHFTPLTIGVHIRRGDYWRFSPVTMAPLERYFQEIDKAVDEHPGSTVFVSTDDGAPVNQRTGEVICEGIVGKLSARYGRRVVNSRPTSLIRSEPEAVQDAVVDLLLLRSTHRFIGTYRSSFSDLSIAGRQVSQVLLGGPGHGINSQFTMKPTRLRPPVRRRTHV